MDTTTPAGRLANLGAALVVVAGLGPTACTGGTEPQPSVQALKAPITGTEQQKLTDGPASCIGLDGSTVVVGRNGSPGESAEVWVRSGTTWTQQQVLTGTTTTAEPQFGQSCGLDGNLAIVGAPEDVAFRWGSAFIFARAGTVWTEQAKLVAADGQTNDLFGFAVDIDGSTAAVTAPNFGALNPEGGSVHVFTGSGSNWTLQQQIIGPVAVGEGFGISVALSGDTLIVGAPHRGLGGRAYVYVRNGTTWSLQQELSASDQSTDDRFGDSVAIDGDVAVVGAYLNNVTTTDDGAAYVFRRTGTVWAEELRLTSPTPATFDWLGKSVGVEGDFVVVGAPYDDERVSDGGAIHVFRYTGGAWVPDTIFGAASGTSNTKLGYSGTAISGDTVASAGIPSGSQTFIGGSFAFGLTLDDGDPCDPVIACASGHCADGVCCDTPCTGTCEACTAAKKGSGVDGECGLIGDGADPDGECPIDPEASCGRDGVCDGAGACRLYASGTQCSPAQCTSGVLTPAGQCDGAGSCVPGANVPCAPGTCSSAGDACTLGCTVSTDCAPGAFCNAGTCEQTSGIGSPCTLAGQCTSGHCVDGVCCDQSCGAPCEACTAALTGAPSDGVCGPVPNGDDPDGDCPDDGAASCARDGQCNGAGQCRLYGPGVACGATSCSGNVVQGRICDGLGSCTDEPSGLDCSPYVCRSSACVNPCLNDGDCTAGHYCDTGVCSVLGGDGTPCAAPTECQSGFCVDGVCCDTACDQDCRACAAALKESAADDGVCGPAAVGTDPHDDCMDEGAVSCQRTGVCNGSGACALYAQGTVCGAGTVCDGRLVKGQTCNGLGSCLDDPIGTDCSPYVCAAGACTSSCASDSDCASNAWCNATVCELKQSNGEACLAARECETDLCVDGFCCAAPCQGQCEACDVPGGEGTCVPVSGAPRGDRPPCDAGAAACDTRVCDGIVRESCAGFVGADVTCQEPSCIEGVATPAARCDGKGSCAVEPGIECGAYVCGEQTCLTSCTSDDDCTGDNRCADGVCVTAATCGDATTVVDVDGKETSCAPYLCVAGACRDSCGAASDCAPGFVCDTVGGVCIRADDDGTDEDGGCACRARPSRQTPEALLLLLATVFAAARRRRETALSSTRSTRGRRRDSRSRCRQ